MRIVEPDGPRHTSIMVIGEAPGEQEEREGKGFVGKTGQLLWMVGREAMLERERCRVANIVWVRPPDNNIKRLGELGVGIHDFLPSLKADILLTNPSVLIAVGETALNALTGMSGITKYRGSILPCTLFGEGSGLWVVPTFHPSWIVRGNHEHRFSLKSDLMKAVRISLQGYQPPEEHFITHARGASFAQMMSVLEEIETKASFLSYDIEGWYPKLDRIAFSYEKNYAISVPFIGSYQPDEELELFRMVKRILEGPTFKIAQNMLFDNDVLAGYGVGIRNVFFDLMLGHKCLSQDLPHSLAYITSIETDVPFYKDDKTKVSSPILVEDYNCRDASVTLEAAFPILKKINNAGLTKFFFSTEMGKVSPTHRMMRVGAKVDEPTRLRILEEKRSELAGLESRLTAIIGHSVNPKSPKQMCFLLYEELKAPHQFNINKKTGERKLTSDEDAIVAILNRCPHLREPLTIILKIRQLSLLIATFLEATQVDGRWFTSYNIGGTKYGGRYSSSKKLDKTGISSQNIPKSVRVCVIPEDSESVIWEADSKQAEARFVVWRSGEESLFQAFREGRDVHLITGSIILEKPEAAITKLEREIAKRINHGTNYWMGPRKMTEIIRKELPDYPINESMTKIYIKRLRRARPMTYQWGCNIRDSLLRGNRVMKNPFGRRRAFQGIFDTEDEMTREAIAFEPQSTVGDLVSIAIGNIQRELGPRAIIFCVHDSVMGSCKKKDIERVHEVVKREMEQVIPGVIYNGIPLSIPCDFKVGPNWGTLKEI